MCMTAMPCVLVATTWHTVGVTIAVRKASRKRDAAQGARSARGQVLDVGPRRDSRSCRLWVPSATDRSDADNAPVPRRAKSPYRNFPFLGSRCPDMASLQVVVGPLLAQNIIFGWGLYTEDVETFAWLDACGIAPRTALQLVHLWGAEAKRRLESNPYELALLESWRHRRRRSAARRRVADGQAALVGRGRRGLREALRAKHTASWSGRWTAAKNPRVVKLRERYKSPKRK